MSIELKRMRGIPEEEDKNFICKCGNEFIEWCQDTGRCTSCNSTIYCHCENCYGPERQENCSCVGCNS